MSIPEWATHIAVDADGMVCVYECVPVFYDYGYGKKGAWQPTRGRYLPVFAAEPGYHYPTSIARLLCIAIPRLAPAEESA